MFNNDNKALSMGLSQGKKDLKFQCPVAGEAEKRIFGGKKREEKGECCQPRTCETKMQATAKKRGWGFPIDREARRRRTQVKRVPRSLSSNPPGEKKKRGTVGVRFCSQRGAKK